MEEPHYVLPVTGTGWCDAVMWRMSEDAMPHEDFCALDEMDVHCGSWWDEWLLRLSVGQVAFRLSSWQICKCSHIKASQCGLSLTFWWEVLLSSSLSSLVFTFFISLEDVTLFHFLPLVFGPVSFLSPPPKYFLPVSTLNSCFTCTLNSWHASFAIPWLKYLCQSFNHTAAVRILIGPFFGSWAKHTALCLGSTIFSIFNRCSSSVVFGCLSSIRSKKPSRMCICTRGQTALCIMIFKVSWSLTLARELRLAATMAKCECASQVWSNMPMMSSSSSCLCCFSCNLQIKSE